MASLAEFVLNLALNPQAAANFRSSVANAQAAMNAAGLSQPQKTALLSGDANKITQAIESEINALADDKGTRIMIQASLPPLSVNP